MSNFDDKISQIYAVLSSTNMRCHENAQAISKLNADVLAVKEKMGQLSEQVCELILENRREQEDLKQIVCRYAEWREQVQVMQADVTLILQHLNQELGKAADESEVR